MVESNYLDMPQIEITLNKVVGLLQKLKPFKACDLHRSNSESLLKEVAKETALHYCHWITLHSDKQNYLMSGNIPTFITPIQC